jgi:hypothetical protein
MNSKLQGDLKATEPDFEPLRLSLEQLELLITANYPINLLVLSYTGTGDDSAHAGSSALLRLEHGKVYLHRIWGCRETKLEVFDTTATLKQTLIRHENHLRLTETPEYYIEKDERTFADGLLLCLKELLRPDSSNSKSWLCSSDLSQDLMETPIIVISMKRDIPPVDARNQKFWISELKYLFAPRHKEKLVLTVFVERDEIPGLYQITGAQEPALKGVYTTQQERATAPPPRVGIPRV